MLHKCVEVVDRYIPYNLQRIIFQVLLCGQGPQGVVEVNLIDLDPIVQNCCWDESKYTERQRVEPQSTVDVSLWIELYRPSTRLTQINPLFFSEVSSARLYNFSTNPQVSGAMFRLGHTVTVGN